MRAVVARVLRASVTVDSAVVGALEEPGLLVLLGVHRDDPPRVGTADDPVPMMARKLHELRVLRGERSDGIDTGRAERRRIDTGRAERGRIDTG